MHRHLYFQSPPIWHIDLAQALETARNEKRRVFFTVGRIDCGGSRALVEKTLSKEEIFDYLTEHFVCIARDADSLDEREQALVAQMRNTARTPYCLYLAPEADGRLVLETAGGRPAAVLLNDLVEAATKKVV